MSRGDNDESKEEDFVLFTFIFLKKDALFYETYIKVKGKWAYLYRAVDKYGDTIDFYLSSTRNANAAKRFLGKALKSIPEYSHPETINTDKNPAYSKAITLLKSEGKCSQELEHRQNDTPRSRATRYLFKKF